jgi:hypothetical protein
MQAATRTLGTPRTLDSPRTWTKRFFTGVGAVCIVLVTIGFGPGVYRGVRGDISIPLVAHVHAAIMVAWLAVYLLQAILAARGDLIRHRRIGRRAAALAGAVWLSMAVATVTTLQRYDPDTFGFLVKPLLVQLGLLAVFPIFVIWGLAARRSPEWHKRLMTIATFSLVQAALDRMHWLPNEGLPMFWHHGIRAYVLLFLPLIVFDLVTRRRIHPATLAGTGLTIAMHGIVSFYWTHAGWDQVARSSWKWVR